MSEKWAGRRYNIFRVLADGSLEPQQPQQRTKRAANSQQLHLHNVYFYTFLQLVLCSESVQLRVASADAAADVPSDYLQPNVLA